MSVFDQIRDSVDIVDVAKMYGVRFTGRKTAHCPFHDDKHPSFSFYTDKRGVERFQCYSGECNAHGDVIDLVGRIENLFPMDAAQEISNAFHLNIDFDKPIDRAEQRRKQAIRDREQELRQWEQDAYWSLMAYEALLDDWMKIYIPLHPSLPISPKYVEASGSKRDFIIYLQDMMNDCRGDLRLMAKFYMTYREFIEKLQRRLEEERSPYAAKLKKNTGAAASKRTVHVPAAEAAVQAL